MNQGDDLERLRSKESYTKKGLVKSLENIFRLLAEHVEANN